MSITFFNKKLLVSVFLAFGILLFWAHDVKAADLPSEGYGWARKVHAYGAGNVLFYRTFDAQTGLPIQVDFLGMSVEPQSGGPPVIYYNCSGNCPANGVVQINSIPNYYSQYGAQWWVRSYPGKAGYHASASPGYFMSVDFPGNTWWTYNVYLTRDSDSYQYKAIFPDPGKWYNFDPTYIAWARPSYATPGVSGAGTQVWVRQFETEYGPNSGPFPTAFSMPARGLVASGGYGWSGFSRDNTGAESGMNGVGFMVDLLKPTVTCSLGVPGIISVTVNVGATDQPGLSGVKDGEFQVRISTDGGATWGAWGTSGIPNGGNVIAGPFSYSYSLLKTYEFRYRARDNSVNASGVNDQWSDYKTCGSLKPKPDYVVHSITPIGTLTVGNPISFNAEVRNTGLADALIVSYGRFCINPTSTSDATAAANCYAVLDPPPVVRVGASNPSILAITRGNFTTISSPAPPWTANSGYKITFCADIQRSGSPNGRIDELNEGSPDNCLTQNVPVTNVLPDLQIIAASASGTVAGQDVTISAALWNSGNAATPAGVTIYNDAVKITGPTIPTFSDITSSPLCATGPACDRSPLLPSWTIPSAPAGSYTIQLCADRSLNLAHNNLVAESDESATSNCKLVSFIVSPPNWVITEGGNVGSVGPITNLDPVGHNSAANNSNVQYIRQICITALCTPVASITDFFNSWKNWLVNSVPEPKAPNTYNSFKKAFSPSSSCSITSAITIPDQKGKFIKTGNFTISAVPSGTVGVGCDTGKDAALIFVEGSLDININLAPSRPTVFIVSENINVNPSVTTINAVLINDRSFNDGVGASILNINGSVISMLSSQPLDQMHLSRDTGDLSEHLILQPSYFYYLSDYAGISPTTFSEERP